MVTVDQTGNRGDPKLSRPLLSIVIPTYNRSHFLRRAVESALAQDYPNSEILIVDNSSTDDTAVILDEYGSRPQVRVHRREKNIGACLNMGLSARDLARGEYVVVLSDDDYFLDRSYLSEAVDILQSDPACVFVHGEVVLEFPQDGIRKTKSRLVRKMTPGAEFFLGFGTERQGFAHLMTVVARRADLVKVRFFDDPDMPHGDSLAWLLLSLTGWVAFVDRAVAVYVIHGGNLITSPNPIAWAKDIRFIEIAANAARDSGLLSTSAVAKWLRRCRHTYCRKVIAMLGPRHSLAEWTRILHLLHARHRIGYDPLIVAAAGNRIACSLAIWVGKALSRPWAKSSLLALMA